MCPGLHPCHLLQHPALCGSTSKHPHSRGFIQAGVPHQESSVLLPIGGDRLRYSLPALHHLCRLPARDGSFSPRRPRAPAALGQRCRVRRQPRLHLVHRTPHRGPLCGAVPPTPPPPDQLPGPGQEDHRGGSGVIARIGRALLLVVGHVEKQPPAHGAGHRPHMDACNYHLLPALQHLLGAELVDNPHAEGQAEATALPGGAWVEAGATSPTWEDHGHAAGHHLRVLCAVGPQDRRDHLPPVRVLSSPRLARPPGLRPVQHAGHAEHRRQLLPLLLRQQAFPRRCAGCRAAQGGPTASSPRSAATSCPHQCLRLLSVQWEQQALAEGLHPPVTPQDQKALVTPCPPPLNPKHPSSHGPRALLTPGTHTAFQLRPWTAASQPWSFLKGPNMNSEEVCFLYCNMSPGVICPCKSD